jgi:hypothetical protein
MISYSDVSENIKPMVYPAVPERKFDVTKWFTQTFTKRPDGRITGYSISYDEYLKMYQNARQIKTDSHEIRFVDKNGEIILGGIDRKSVDEFSYAGEWDSPKFSEIERELAWRIECNRIMHSYNH